MMDRMNRYWQAETNFLREPHGSIGDYWQQDAKRRVSKVMEDIANGDITVTNGVARNCAGRCLCDDQLAVAKYLCEDINVYETTYFREIETQQELEEYIRYRKEHGYSNEELAEMRATLGNQRCMDVLTGEYIN